MWRGLLSDGRGSRDAGGSWGSSYRFGGIAALMLCEFQQIQNGPSSHHLSSSLTSASIFVSSSAPSRPLSTTKNIRNRINPSNPISPRLSTGCHTGHTAGDFRVYRTRTCQHRTCLRHRSHGNGLDLWLLLQYHGVPTMYNHAKTVQISPRSRTNL
jgi:hypothetical protein